MNYQQINSIISDNDELDTNKISDGYHTFGELYEHRIRLFIALCKSISILKDSSREDDYDDYIIRKSKLHFDRSELQGWFIVQMETPEGQISYHLPNSYWDACDFIFTAQRADQWDGHTSDDVLERLLKI